jgi:hypothetical protein
MPLFVGGNIHPIIDHLEEFTNCGVSVKSNAIWEAHTNEISP